MGAFHVIQQDQANGIDVSVGNETWILAESVYLTGSYGFDSFASMGTGRRVRIDGHVVVDGNGVNLGKVALSGGQNKVEIGKSGSVEAGESGVYLKGGGNIVTNYGTISATGPGVLVEGGFDQIINRGSITNLSPFTSLSFGVSIVGDSSTLENSGTISGNSGVDVHGDYVSILNSGSIVASSLGAGNGQTSPAIQLDGSDIHVKNTGLISIGSYFIASAAIIGSIEGDMIVNSGKIVGSLHMLAGDDDVDNSGGQIVGNVLLGTGNDKITLNGSSVTAVYGGSGDDTYIIDSSKLKIIENTGEGTDTVYSSVSYALRSNFEYLVLTGDDDIRGTGNALANRITGNAGDNKLFGGAGDDLMEGGGGADVINGGKGNDSVSYVNSDDGVIISLAGGRGVDGDAEGDLLINVENVIGSAGGDDVLTGSSAANKFYGQGGSDTMRGMGGADTFYFAIFQSPVANNDVILDYQDGVDKIGIFDGIANLDSYAEIMSVASQQGANVVFNFSATDTLTIRIVTLAQLDASDFTFKGWFYPD